MLSVGLRIPKKTIAVLLLAIIAAAVIIVVKSVYAADKKTVAEFDGSAAYDYISSFGVCADDGGLVIDEITVPEYFGDQVLDTAAITKALQKENLHPGEQLVVTIDDSGTVFAVKKERKK